MRRQRLENGIKKRISKEVRDFQVVFWEELEVAAQTSPISEPFLLGQGDFWGGKQGQGDFGGAKGRVWAQLGEKGGGRWWRGQEGPGGGRLWGLGVPRGDVTWRGMEMGFPALLQSFLISFLVASIPFSLPRKQLPGSQIEVFP